MKQRAILKQYFYIFCMYCELHRIKMIAFLVSKIIETGHLNHNEKFMMYKF